MFPSRFYSFIQLLFKVIRLLLMIIFPRYIVARVKISSAFLKMIQISPFYRIAVSTFYPSNVDSNILKFYSSIFICPYTTRFHPIHTNSIPHYHPNKPHPQIRFGRFLTFQFYLGNSFAGGLKISCSDFAKVS